MSSVKEILEYEIYPALYSNIQGALPEFKFQKIRGGYISTSKTKITGETGSSSGKVYIYDNNINHLIDYTRGSKSLWDYIQERDQITENKDVLKRLAELSGVTLQRGSYNTQEYISHKKNTQLWEDVNSYLTGNLENAKGNKAKEIKDYLTKRGYTTDDIKSMELGYLPSQEHLNKFLIEEKKHSAEEINTIKLHTAIGETHTLTIPLREPVGNIIGITARNINYKDGDKNGKYLNSTGLYKTDKLFNLRALKGKKDLIIVEGLLDCLLASSRGVENIVALGGKSFNVSQLQTAIKYGAQKITICLDNEEQTIENILNAINVIKNNSELKVYVAQLPDKIKDVDELITKKGAEALTTVISEAVAYWEYKLQYIFNKYIKEQNHTGLTTKQEDEFLEDIYITASSIDEPIDRDRFIKTFLSLEETKSLGINKGSLEETVERLQYKKDVVKQERKLKALLEEATSLQNKGELTEALDVLQLKAREIKQENSKVTFESLLISPTEQEIEEGISNKPESISSGYKIDKDEELFLPSGAITIFSAPTSHCKTTMLLNLAINTAEIYPDKQFHVFSYEEDRDIVLLKALNIFSNIEVSKNNLRTLKSYYSKNSEGKYKFFDRGEKNNINGFEVSKTKFYREFIDTQRLNIHYVDYSSDTLIEAIDFINKRKPVGAVFIDYMQLLKKAKGKYNSRQEELKTICLELKDVAVNTGLPIILGAQFNREVINHTRLHATNIGEAGDIERIANTIIGLWNNNFKPLDMKLNDLNGKYLKANTIYGKVLKMREGKINTEFLLKFKGNTGKIEDYKENPF